MENNLVNEYVALGEIGISPDVACPAISGILFRQGAQHSSKANVMLKSGKVNESKMSSFLGNAFNLLESAITIEPN